jgi:hypothetical protein
MKFKKIWKYFFRFSQILQFGVLGCYEGVAVILKYAYKWFLFDIQAQKKILFIEY